MSAAVPLIFAQCRGRGSFVLVPGLCPRVYLYLLVLNESAACKVYHSWTVNLVGVKNLINT